MRRFRKHSRRISTNRIHVQLAHVEETRRWSNPCVYEGEWIGVGEKALCRDVNNFRSMSLANFPN